MEKTYFIGKIDFNGNGRKVNKVSVTFNLDCTGLNGNGKICTALYHIYNGSGKKIIAGGICGYYRHSPIDNFDEVRNSPIYMAACAFTRKYGTTPVCKYEKTDGDLLSWIIGK